MRLPSALSLATRPIQAVRFQRTLPEAMKAAHDLIESWKMLRAADEAQRPASLEAFRTQQNLARPILEKMNQLADQVSEETAWSDWYYPQSGQQHLQLLPCKDLQLPNRSAFVHLGTLLKADYQPHPDPLEDRAVRPLGHHVARRLRPAWRYEASRTDFQPGFDVARTFRTMTP